jgi:hypothetical protein
LLKSIGIGCIISPNLSLIASPLPRTKNAFSGLFQYKDGHCYLDMPPPELISQLLTCIYLILKMTIYYFKRGVCWLPYQIVLLYSELRPNRVTVRIYYVTLKMLRCLLKEYVNLTVILLGLSSLYGRTI